MKDERHTQLWCDEIFKAKIHFPCNFSLKIRQQNEEQKTTSDRVN